MNNIELKVLVYIIYMFFIWINKINRFLKNISIISLFSKIFDFEKYKFNTYKFIIKKNNIILKELKYF